jgi:hypothetical protein
MEEKHNISNTNFNFYMKQNPSLYSIYFTYFFPFFIYNP